jgi:hypothetical protein
LEEFRRKLGQNFSDPLDRLLVTLAALELRKPSNLVQPRDPVAPISPALKHQQPLLQQSE